MKEKSDFSVGAKRLAHHHGNQEKMIIMYPDSVTTFVVFDNDIGDGTVNCLEILPRVIQESP